MFSWAVAEFLCAQLVLMLSLQGTTRVFTFTLSSLLTCHIPGVRFTALLLSGRTNNWKTQESYRIKKFPSIRVRSCRTERMDTVGDRCAREALGQLLLQPRHCWLCATSSEFQEDFSKAFLNKIIVCPAVC